MQLFKKFKMLKKVNSSHAMKEARELDYNKDGSVQINVGLKSVDDFYSPCAYKTYEIADSDVIGYINMCEESIPDNEKISIDFYVETPTDYDEKRRIRESVKRYYAEKIVRIKKRQRRNVILGLSYFILGIVLLILESFFYSFFKNIHTEILVEVIGWLFMWDGIETLLDDWASLGEQKKQSYHLISAKIHVRKYSKSIQREYGIGDFKDDNDDDDD